MGNEIYPGVNAVPPAISGMSHVTPGCGVGKLILVRDDTDGVIVNAETLSSKENSNGRLLGGFIDISRATIITLCTQFSFASLTSIDIMPSFLDRNLSGSVHSLGAGAISAGVITMSRSIFRYPASLGTLDLIVSFANPGSNFMQLFMASAGVVTSSFGIVQVGLGWGTRNFPGIS